MIKRLELLNFMSHPHTVIEFAPGLTVLVGENNCGKSAVVSALQTLCQNAQGGYMVRHGERDCVVRIETEDDHVIQWRRHRKAVSYNIDGRDIHRLGGDVPDDLHQKLRLSLVDAPGGSFDVHFGEQKKPIFLLNESAGRRATFFASSSDAVRLIEMQNLHRRNVQEQRVRKRDLTKRQVELDGRLAALDPLKRIEPELRTAETLFNRINEQAHHIAEFNRTVALITEATVELHRHVAESEALAALTSPPLLHPTHQLIELINQFTLHTRSADDAGAQTTALASLSAPPRLEPIEPLKTLIGQIEAENTDVKCNEAADTALALLDLPPTLEDDITLATVIDRLETAVALRQAASAKSAMLCELAPPPRVDATEPLTSLIATIDNWRPQFLESQAQVEVLTAIGSPPALEATTALSDIIDRLATASQAFEMERRRERVLTRIEEPPQPTDDTALRELIDTLETQQTTITRRQRDVDTAETARAANEQELRRAVAELGNCPLCGGRLDADKLVAVAAPRGDTP